MQNTAEARLSNRDRFLSAYNKIDAHLRREIGVGREPGFRWVIEEAARGNAVARKWMQDLRHLADLRNVLVHSFIGEPIAEPSIAAVKGIERVRDQITRPPGVDLFTARGPVYTVRPQQVIGAVLAEMTRNSYSQVPVYTDGHGFEGLLTSDAITRWLGTQVNEDLVSLADTRVGQVLKHAEADDTADFVERTAPLVRVVEQFQDAQVRGRRLEAILVTASGTSAQDPQGIITTSDLAEVMRLLG